MEGRMDGSRGPCVALWGFPWPCGALCGSVAGNMALWPCGRSCAILWPCGKLWQAVPCGRSCGPCGHAMQSSGGSCGRIAWYAVLSCSIGHLTLHQETRLSIANWYMFPLWGVCIFWRRGYVRMTPSVNFPLKSRGRVKTSQIDPSTVPHSQISAQKVGLQCNPPATMPVQGLGRGVESVFCLRQSIYTPSP